MVSAIDDLLRILESSTPDTLLKSDLQEFRVHFDTVYSKIHSRQINTYDIISEYRNALMHGEILWQIIYAALTNLICLLLTSLIQKSEYESRYGELMQLLEMRFHTRLSGHQDGYYPP